MPQQTIRSKSSFISGFLLHLHPRTVPAETLRVSLSYGLGGLAALLLLVQFVTGLLQLLLYTPGIEAAYNSILRMYSHVPLGGWIRNIHYWGGNCLVVVAGLHLLRVFLTGAIASPRILNWYLGLMLLLLTVFANFTGYLLPWDQLSYWAATIFTSMFSYLPAVGDRLVELFRGGEDVGANTLAIFFAIHVGLLPLLFVIITTWHFWQVRKAGGLICRDPDDPTVMTVRVNTVPALIERELFWGFGFLAMLLIFASLIDAPLAEPANPGLSPNPAKGGWYLVGLQELLLHLHPTFAIWVVPAVMLLLLLLIPAKSSNVLTKGVWLGDRDGRRAGIAALACGLVLTITAVLIDDFLLRTDQLQPENEFWNRGVFFLTGYLMLLAGSSIALLRWKKITAAKMIMIFFLFHVGVLLALTSVGGWFRGPGMRLVWPF